MSTKVITDPALINGVMDLCRPEKLTALVIEGYYMTDGELTATNFFEAYNLDGGIAIGPRAVAEKLYLALSEKILDPEFQEENVECDNEVMSALWPIDGDRAAVAYADAGGSDCLQFEANRILMELDPDGKLFEVSEDSHFVPDDNVQALIGA